MDAQRVDMYLLANQKFFPAEKLMYLKEKLLNMDDSRFEMLSVIELKDPTMYLVISILLGYLGVDRFMLGDIGMGILKLLTWGVCWILYIIDFVTISGKVKEMNFTQVMTML